MNEKTKLTVIMICAVMVVAPGVLVLILLVLGAMLPQADPPSAGPVFPVQGRAYAIDGDCAGCTYERQLEKLDEYAAQEDTEAWVRAFHEGRCTKLYDGEIVFVVEVSVLGARVKVRRQGETGEYWTHAGSIKQ
jgi:hypothetical protein